VEVARQLVHGSEGCSVGVEGESARGIRRAAGLSPVAIKDMVENKRKKGRKKKEGRV